MDRLEIAAQLDRRAGQVVAQGAEHPRGRPPVIINEELGALGMEGAIGRLGLAHAVLEHRGDRGIGFAPFPGFFGRRTGRGRRLGPGRRRFRLGGLLHADRVGEGKGEIERAACVDLAETGKRIAAPGTVAVALDREGRALGAEAIALVLEIASGRQQAIVVVPILQFAHDRRGAFSGVEIPPALGHPLIAGLVAHGDRLARAALVAQFQVRSSHPRQKSKGHRRHHTRRNPHLTRPADPCGSA